MRAAGVVAIGGSAGAIEALRTLVAGLPEDFPFPICIVLHTSPESPAVLDSILERAGRLKAVTARNGERLVPGRIYIAPPDCHLVIEPGKVRITKGPRENRFRPAIDPLFRSAAQVYGPAAIGVILTGNLDDGTAGLWAIKQLGGTAIVQDPKDALFPSMPKSAIEQVQVDYVKSVADIPALLQQLTSVPVEEVGEIPVPDHVDVEVKIAKEHNALDAGLERVSAPSSYACPECHGVLLQLKEGDRVRFRCHTGHAYSLESLLAAISEGIEESLWIAIRALEEGGLLMHRMAEHFKVSHNGNQSKNLAERAEQAHRQSELVRKLMNDREPLTAATKA